MTVVHPGTQHAPLLATQLWRRGLLREFHTGVGFTDVGCLRRLVRPGANNRFARTVARRVARGVPAGKIRLHPAAELLAKWRLRRGDDMQEALYQRDQCVQRRLPDHVFEQSEAVVGFDTAGWIVAQRCRVAGIPFILDQTIGHPGPKADIYERVRKEFPAWSDTLDVRRPEVLAAENIEHQLAARIVTASTFTRRTLVLSGVALEKIVVNPYGVDAAQFSPGGGHRGRPLRFAFVGQIGARKGIPLLLEAWAALAPRNAELWLIGHVPARLRPLLCGIRGVVVQGAVSHRALPALLHECDVFVFPSYFEGFGLVLLEAMACGLPAIASDATAAPDVVTDGADGFVFPAGDGAALRACIAWFLADARRCRTMGDEAVRTAGRFTWDAYGERWAAMVREMIQARELSLVKGAD